MDKKKTIFLTPHSHYDVVWAFTKDDYYLINEIILTDAVKMINSGGFKFLIEQTLLLEMIEERNPSLFASIKEAVQGDCRCTVCNGRSHDTHRRNPGQGYHHG